MFKKSKLFIVIIILLSVSQIAGWCYQPRDRIYIDLTDDVIAAGGSGYTHLMYSKRNPKGTICDVCGFEIHWQFDPLVMYFPDCSLGGACPLAPSSILCVCGVSQPGHLEVAVITSDGVTPLPDTLTLIGEFVVEVSSGALPDDYVIYLERPSDHDEVQYVCCDLSFESKKMEFTNGYITVP